MKRIIGFILLYLCTASIKAQFTYGTTGLLHMPTADMQKDKTFMAGGGYLSKHATPDRWYYDTWNYYINITFFPWLEVAYTCTIFDEWRSDRKVYMKNQDRFFSGRLRLWKEGWWKEWTQMINCPLLPNKKPLLTERLSYLSDQMPFSTVAAIFSALRP